MVPVQSELRIPADPAFVMVAKRATAGFAAVAGLHVEALEDLVIAVAQACEHTIAALRRTVGPDVGQIKLEFHIDGPCMHVHVNPLISRADIVAARARREAEHRRLAAAAARRREAGLKRELVATRDRSEREEALATSELALKLMGLFVDDFGYRLDDRTGAMRVRLTKYRAS